MCMGTAQLFSVSDASSAFLKKGMTLLWLLLCSLLTLALTLALPLSLSLSNARSLSLSFSLSLSSVNPVSLVCLSFGACACLSLRVPLCQGVWKRKKRTCRIPCRISFREKRTVGSTAILAQCVCKSHEGPFPQRSSLAPLLLSAIAFRESSAYGE